MELGDLIDKGPSTADDKQYLAAACEGLTAFPGSRHYVLGNHCVTTLTKAEFLKGCGQKPTLSHHYSFDHGGWHFVVLDADFRRDETPYEPGKFHWTDTWVPAAQLAWLQRDLAEHSTLPCVIFVHQNLHDHTQSWGIKNADAVRKVLEASGNVVAVLQGHKHDGAYARIEGIDYYTFKAMVEGKTADDNAYALVGLGPGRKVRIEGFGRQPSRTIG